MKTVRRYDYGRIDNVSCKDSGAAIYDASFTRCGVFIYVDPITGEEIAELRPPEEVFNRDSLDTLRMVPFTNDHPPEMLNIDNTKEFAQGCTGEYVWVDLDHVYGKVVCQTREILDAVAGGKVETSCGYFADIEELAQPQVWEGPDCPGMPGIYTRIQRNIRYNHVSLVEEGRAQTTKLKFDAGESKPVARFDTAIQKVRQSALTIPKKDETDMATKTDDKDKKDKKDETPSTVPIKIKGVDFNAEPALAAVLNVMGVCGSEETPEGDEEEETPAEDPKKPETPMDSADANRAKADALVAKLAKDKKVKDKKDLQSKIDAAVSARLDLEREAKKYATDADFKGKTDSEVKKLAVSAALPDAKLDGKSAEYVDTMWDYVLENVPAENVETHDKEDKLDQAVGETKGKSARPKRDAWTKPRLAAHV